MRLSAVLKSFHAISLCFILYRVSWVLDIVQTISRRPCEMTPFWLRVLATWGKMYFMYSCKAKIGLYPCMIMSQNE